MQRIVSISFGEIALKGLNRSYFEKKLLNQIKRSIKGLGESKVYRDQGKIYVITDDENIERIVEKLKKVFGIVYISPGYRVEKDIEKMIEKAIESVKQTIAHKEVKTFKVQVKRADKKFPIKSMDVARKIGAAILREIKVLKVDVNNPDLLVKVDIRDYCYIYTDKIKGYGGLPVGTNGRALLLLSGGIDSPVAGFMIAKRGVSIDAVHFHSYPFTSERAEEKVKKLAGLLSEYCGNMKLYSVNILPIQREITEKCPEDEMTIISRRFMMRIAERIAEKEGIDALITGESLGQVASQTIKSLNVTNSVVKRPVFRPLIGMDKVEITEIAVDIGTYETSILPYEDCCTVFLPKHPVTRPKLEDIEKSEASLDVENLVEDAIRKMKIIEINFQENAE
ncbi:thiamine biosynthesis protein ThiI [Caloranaerobacter azorensis H53214]|uniref:Probable tRNA sulfurtransferase n=1 Tax=Caloranaerobacter azorensis H53214 TaxID=1156417 RepID=A0A096BGA2_9FIRM|nr:tRNA uracil 4-sulfurtransferase ThiI [Caloranaerobacter azorensis]KGG79768.1 thiamine biosynthesis protein ThiI [Caloranaerobacter azorensis H53214]